MEKTCSCAVSRFVLDVEGRVRCDACRRPITGGPAAHVAPVVFAEPDDASAA